MGQGTHTAWRRWCTNARMAVERNASHVLTDRVGSTGCRVVRWEQGRASSTREREGSSFHPS
eukprot:scaffold867_cov317-Pavlova_lutheri.AAC.37